jgi:subtilisin family serine protease
MYVRKILLAVLVLALSVSFYSCSNDDGTNPFPGERLVRGTNDQYIIAYNDKNNDSPQSYDANAKAISLLESQGISSSALIDTYSHALNGFSAKLTPEEAERLMNDNRVGYIEPDQEFHLPDFKVVTDEKIENDKIQAQTTPWGITYIGGAGTANSHYAWILDTGVDLDHPDLNVNTTLSKTFVKLGKDSKSADDLNGHGTHVSGTIAAKNNTVGVIGVAPGATVVAVKVLNLNGSGYTTDIIKGLDYIASKATAGDVINISLGGGASTALDDAVKNCAGKGIFVSVAAGNSAANAANYSPARVNVANVFTISAHNSSGVFASWSNWGNPPVDFSAPGVSVYSTYKGGKYATMSGTSMATPHVAGILLVNGGTVNSNGTVTGDPDGTPDIKAHR